ncbi:MAG: hypothetical protein ACFB15_12015 [Cyclobacteriaceae bacterium]
MKIFVVSIFLLAFTPLGFAQSLGGPATGMAEAGVAQRDAWSTFYNVGGIAWVKHTTLVAGYENRFGFSEGLHAAGVGLVKPMGFGTASLSVYRFGDELYSEDQIALGFGHQVSQFSFGFRLSGYQYHIETVGTRFTSALDVGGIAKLSSELTFGMQITNLTQAKKSSFTGERIPTRLQTGLDYRPAEAVQLVAEVEHEVQEETNVKLGAEYTIREKISLRSGVQTAYFQQFFGLGLLHRLLQIDYALRNHTELGMSHQLSLAYKLER